MAIGVGNSVGGGVGRGVGDGVGLGAGVGTALGTSQGGNVAFGCIHGANPGGRVCLGGTFHPLPQTTGTAASQHRDRQSQAR